jgi:DMSO/TMAO reductase YedYZ molybdopterin-dependent catalytic subunit
VTRPVSRRQLLRLAATAGVGVVITGCRRGRVLTDERELATAALTDPRAATEYAHRATDTPPAQKSTPHPAPSAQALGIDSDLALTANEDFYTMKYNPSPPPEVDAAAWRLAVDGAVATPLSLTLADLQALRVDTLMRTLECISNPAGGTLIGNAVWRGVRLAEVLAAAGVQSAGQNLKLTSYDGYHTGIPLALAQDERSYLVFEMNGEPLPAAHGFPLRCLFPGRYGQKQPKWLTGITLQAQPHPGHWEKQGWSDTAVIRVNSRIDAATRPDAPGEPVVVRGIAFSDDSGIAGVELIIDKSESFPATLLRRAPEPFTPLVWTEWEWTWPDPPPGNHVIQAKAKSGAGIAQNNPRKNLLSGTFPDGTSDMVQVSVQVPAG